VKVHFEPYLHLAGVTHKSVLVGWGGFYFKMKGEDGAWKLLDDVDLDNIHPPRSSSIGAKSDCYGHGRVEVLAANGTLVTFAETTTANHAWVTGLDADTEYTYRVLVNGREWAAGPRRDWAVEPPRQGLVESGRHYENHFRTHPHPDASADLTFAAIGDFGTGVRHPSSPERQQREVADALERTALAKGVRLILTTGDNIYAGRTLLGVPIGTTGDEDDDWFFTFYQPYRYLLNRIPFYPSIGNHDGNETERNDDRDQVLDNFHLVERLQGETAAGRASIGPGLFYRFRYGSDVELICLDSSRQSLLFGERFFRHANHAPFLEAAFPSEAAASPRWRVPFLHHPAFCAGPMHGNSKSVVEHLVPLFRRCGVRLVLAGHEHNYQHSHKDGIDYFVTGGGGKVRGGRPQGMAEAHTREWAALCHFLLVEIAGGQATVTPIGGSGEPLRVESPDGQAAPAAVRVTA
jgi:tartrate-resistant acid phosphatase type 5